MKNFHILLQKLINRETKIAPGEKAMRCFHPEPFDEDYEEDDEEKEDDITD